MLNFRQITNVSIFSLVVGFMLPANAIPNFNSITVTTPTGSNDTSDPYTDDVLVDTLKFEDSNGNVSATFEANDTDGNSFRAVQRLTVTGDRNQTNAEWGDNDDNNDGNDNPFEKAGFSGQNQETIDPTIQDATLLEAFNSRSLSEMADGEGEPGKSFGYKMIFENGLTDDNNNIVDDVPEIILFERNSNDRFDIQLITGGTFDKPTLTSALTTDSRSGSNPFTPTGISINTQEIPTSQEIGVLGLDFNDFGLSNGETVYGIKINAPDGEGPDLNGTFLASEDPSRFTSVPSGLATPVPFEVEGTMGFLALGGYLWYRRHKKHQRFQDQ